MGLGMIIGTKKRSYLHLFPFGLAVLVVTVILIESSGLGLPLATESSFLWNGLSRDNSQGPLSYPVMIAFFALTAIIFVPLGQEMGARLQDFKPIPGYSINILGSLLGVAGLALISYLRWPPVAWFTFGAACFVAYFVTSGRLRLERTPALQFTACAIVLGCTLAVVSVAHKTEDGKYSWSPYYEILTSDLVQDGQKIGFNVAVNRDSHQQALDLSDDRPPSDFLTHRRALYDLPYTLSTPKDVLVLGAGTGNDVAAALRADATHVKAVEIDPVIADIGKDHPEHPYADARVDLKIDDARSFLQKSDDKYDLIVFGFLDSHRLFSSMSSVRMDNYVYTIENMKNVRRHLADDGVLSLTFTVHEKWIADRLFGLLSEVFGHDPTVYQGNEQAWGTTYLVAKDRTIEPPAPLISPAQFRSDILPAAEGHTWAYAETGGYLDNDIFDRGAQLPTDNWPFLYMRSHQIPANYLWVLLATFLVALLLIRLGAGSTGLGEFANWNFFFLGVAFALLETKGITDIALLFGSTWITNSIVISGVLAMILFANLLVLRFQRIPLAPVYALLVFSLLFNYQFSFHGLLGLPYEARLIAAAVQVSLPLFFAGIIFATHFRDVREPSVALGANLVGAMAGGLLEYSSLVVGQQALYLAALAFYICSLAVVLTGRRLRKGAVARLAVPNP
jgi:hypothetical protein